MMLRLPFHLSAATLLTALMVMILMSLTWGAVTLPKWPSLLAISDALLGLQTSTLAHYQQAIVLELRVPRTLLSLFIGCVLAQCGCITQCIFRNPLADPGIIGISSGAAIGAIAAIILLPEQSEFWSVPLAAFGAGLGTTLLVYSLAQTRNGTAVFVLLLAGVAVSAFAGAAIGFMSYFTDDENLRGLSAWQMGSLTHATPTTLWICFATALILAGLFQRYALALNALLLGENEARHLGIAVRTLKTRLIFLTAIGVGVAVAAAGIIGFVGLIVPHLIRLLCGPDHRILLPLSGLCGALLLLCSDLLSRLAIQPAELPVGIITALLGAPFFIVLLFQQRRHLG